MRSPPQATAVLARSGPWLCRGPTPRSGWRWRLLHTRPWDGHRGRTTAGEWLTGRLGPPGSHTDARVTGVRTSAAATLASGAGLPAGSPLEPADHPIGLRRDLNYRLCNAKWVAEPVTSRTSASSSNVISRPSSRWFVLAVFVAVVAGIAARDRFAVAGRGGRTGGPCVGALGPPPGLRRRVSGAVCTATPALSSSAPPSNWNGPGRRSFLPPPADGGVPPATIAGPA